MKAIVALVIVCVAGALFTGCEKDVPPDHTSDAAAKLKRGVAGEGTVYQPDRSADPIIRENTRVGY